MSLPTIREYCKQDAILLCEPDSVISHMAMDGEAKTVCGLDIVQGWTEPNHEASDGLDCMFCLVGRIEDLLPETWHPVWQNVLEKLLECEIDLAERELRLAEVEEPG